MKTAFCFTVSFLLAVTSLLSQPINFKVYSPTGGFLKIIYATHKPGESTYYLKNNKPVPSQAESDLYVKVSEDKDTIHINSFYTGSDQPALSYSLLRKGGELHYQHYAGYDQNGDLLGYAHNLYWGKGIVLVKDHEMMGVEVYRNGEKIAHYAVAKFEEERLIVYELGNIKKQGVLNMDGDPMVPVQYDLINLAEHVFVARNEQQKVGAFDINGKPLVPFEYDQVMPEENMIITWINIKNNDKENYGIFDRKGNMITPPLNPVFDFTSGPLPVVGPDGNYGYVTDKAVLLTGFEFKYAKTFSEGLAAVANQKGEYGFIDLTGKLVVPYKFYNVVANFENGRARVSESRFKKAYEIDHNGNRLN